MPKSLGWVVVVVGIVLLLLAVFASQLGIGGATWGARHIVALVAGLVLIAGGLFTAVRPSGMGA